MRRCVVLLLISVTFGCGGSDNPTGPTQSQVRPPVHDTLNAAGDQTIFEVRLSQDNVVVYDDITLPRDTNLTTLSFQGAYCNVLNGVSVPGPIATGFRVGVYLDRSGRPSGHILGGPDVVFERTYPKAEVSERLDFEVNQRQQTCGDGAAYYSYAVSFSPPLALKANTRYWLGIRGEVPANPRQVYWAWRVGRADNLAALTVVGGSTYGEWRTDQAFLLRD